MLLGRQDDRQRKVLLREVEVPVGVPPADRVVLARLFELLERVFANGFEHREVLVPVAEEAFLDQ